jgi:N-acetylmuramoyl-L-alanine amidase
MLNIKQIPSPNFETGNTSRSLIVIHHIVGSFQSCINHFSKRESAASAHFIISKDGDIVQMVDEDNTAWHCNPSRYKNYPIKFEGLNHISLGIELEGPPSYIGLKEWPFIQIDFCADLINILALSYPVIKITDHSTIDYGLGKIDVKKNKGIDLFPWDQLLSLISIEEA